MAQLNLSAQAGNVSSQIDPTPENCLKSMCGYWDQAQTQAATDESGNPFLLECANRGYVGSRQTCGPGADPRCADYADVVRGRDNGQGLACRVAAQNQMPAMTTATMPTVTGTAQATTPSQQPVITADYLNQRMPNIVNPAPVVIPPPCWDFARWVGDNELLVALALGVGIMFAWGKGGR